VLLLFWGASGVIFVLFDFPLTSSRTFGLPVPEFTELGIHPVRGLLLYGKPGKPQSLDALFDPLFALRSISFSSLYIFSGFVE
jgi:hypothetical protein